MARERLIFKGVSEILGTENMGLLILTDELMERQITIVCDKAMAVQIELRLKMIPISNIMLPEVMCNLLKTYTDLNLEIVIEDIIDGQYRTLLYNADTLDPMLIRASDAVLLSLIGEIPIYIDSKLMKRQSTEYRENANGVTLPVNSISDEMLQSALDRAIAEENYELASHLRDEQKRREHNEESKTSTK
ncbi:MAG: DUF151 domain-containing protein [Prevotellaceae bacterium]|nr:DUF151 domain-containing protein [Prevotellaceae bacterium]